MTMQRKAHALARTELVHAITPINGVATVNGTVNSLIDSSLHGLNDFFTGKVVELLSGPSTYETQFVKSFDPVLDTLVFTDNYSSAVLAGTEWRLLNIAGMDLTLAAQINKLAGATPVSGPANQTWFTAESDIVTFGAAGVKYKVNDFSISMANLVGTVINVRMYKTINGTPVKFYDETFDATVDPPGIDLITGIVAIHDPLRVTLQSNNVLDDGKNVDFDYMLEAQ